MKKLWTKGKTGAAAVLLACFLAALAASTSGSRLARPEREDPGADQFIGFHMVLEKMPKEGEEIPVDQSHWVEYGTEEMKTEDFGTLSFPKKILIGRFTDDPHGQDYEFPGLPGLNCFLAEEELEEGGTQYAGTSGLAGPHIKVGDEEESISGTVYFGPPLDDRNWNTNEFDYCWTAYQVYQMEDGTVYLDGSGNSYGGMGGFTTKVTDTQTKTADGEEEIFSFTAEVTMESVERVTELEVRWYGEEELLDRRTLTMEEVGEGLSLERPQGAVWALVTQRDRTGDTERSVYTLGTEAGASHHLVQLDERGMGRVVYLNLD